MTHFRLATRGSDQARTQATAVAEALTAAGYTSELIIVDTYGDRTQASEVPLHSIGGQGVFTKEIQRAVLDGRADLAVHSAKDLPTDPVSGLTIGAFTARRSPHDALVGGSIVSLPSGATVATGSVRRRAQLARRRPDLRFVELRGNIPTRLERIPEGGAIVMALAALEVLGCTDRAGEVLPVDEFIPAVGQGCVAIECRTEAALACEALAAIDHGPTRRAVSIERAFLNELGSGCSNPVAAHVDGEVLYTFLANDNGLSVSDQVVLSTRPGDDLAPDLDRARVAARSAAHAVGGDEGE